MPKYRLRGEQRLQVEWIVTADSPEEAERRVVEEHQQPFNVVAPIETEVWDEPVETA